MSKTSEVTVMDLGLIAYSEAYRYQKEILVKRQLGQVEDILIILEHLPVITWGRTSKRSDLLVDDHTLRKEGISFCQADRGGGLTYHGPGQLVSYPILNLRGYTRDIHLYLRRLEEVIINLLARYGVAGTRLRGLTGVWVYGKKICSIGIGISRWVTFHGLSLNVNPNMEHFSMIRPCGMANDVMTSLCEILDRPFQVKDVKISFIKAFLEVFGLESEPNGIRFSALA